MANETQFLINGNFFIARDITTRNEYFREIASAIKFTRFPNDEFVFFNNNNTTINQYDDQRRNTLGITDIDKINGDPLTFRTNFTYADSVDEFGVPFPSADALDDWLSENLGIEKITLIGAGYLTYVATDATLTGDGTPSNPLSVVPDADLYEERFDLLAPLVVSAWHSIHTGQPNRLLAISIDSDVNNNLCGVRATGSGLSRFLSIDKDSTSYWMVKADALGDIEVYTMSLGTEIRIESIIK
jgi:hypothetical protein